MFKLTTKSGKLVVETERVTTDTGDFDAGLIFEQDPVQIIDALLPLYMNSTLLRALQVQPSALSMVTGSRPMAHNRAGFAVLLRASPGCHVNALYHDIWLGWRLCFI